MRRPALLGVFLLSAAVGASAQPTALARLVEAVREKARAQEGSSGVKLAFRSFTASHGLPADLVSYSDFSVVRLLFESTRDAGLWNLQWTITNLPPDSDNVWKQWGAARRPSYPTP